MLEREGNNMSIGFRIITDFNRAEQRLLDKFKELPVSNVADSINDLFCMSINIKLMNDNKDLRMLGTALTVKTLATDNLMVNKAVDMGQPGDVIVVDAGGNCNKALIGELMAQYASSKNLAGFIINGCIRDIATISEIDFPVYARGVNPQGPVKHGPGEINTTISCGGVVVRPGDIILGDADGIVVVKPEEAEKIARKATEISKKEAKIEKAIKNGDWDRTYIDEILTEKGCEMI